MKIKYLIIIPSLLMIFLPLHGEDIIKKEILDSLEFPEPELNIGGRINDPFFSINLYRPEIDKTEIRKSIANLEKTLKDKSDPDMFYELGNYHNSLMNAEDAEKYYKKYIDSTYIAPGSAAEDIKTVMNKGDVYYSLSEINRKNRTDNLEKSLLYFTKAAELNPENITIWRKLGDCYLSLNKTTEALYCYNKVLEKNRKDFLIYSRLQSVLFQRDYLKLSNSRLEDKLENLPVDHGFDFEYIQTAINNSSKELKDSLILQQYIYLLRVMLIKNKRNFQMELNTGIVKDEDIILIDAEKFIKSIKSKNISSVDLKYLSAIINYLKSDYDKSFSDFKEILSEGGNIELFHDEILFLSLNTFNNKNGVKKTIEDMIKINPDPKDYLVLAVLEYKNKNLSAAEMLCHQSLKVNEKYPEAYSGISVISAINGNYITADEMIKKGNYLLQKENSKKTVLINRMKTNEAAIALLKNEKERAYILLRSVLSVDNNVKASLLYNRYFIKNEKIQN